MEGASSSSFTKRLEDQKPWNYKKRTNRYRHFTSPMSVAQMVNVVAHQRMRGGLTLEEYRDVGIGPNISKYEDKAELEKVEIIKFAGHISPD